jgi:hypothetical protein
MWPDHVSESVQMMKASTFAIAADATRLAAM